jgi:hypothetical protein
LAVLTSLWIFQITGSTSVILCSPESGRECVGRG